MSGAPPPGTGGPTGGTGARPERLVVVVGTGTEVGKTWVAARLLGLWRRQGLTVAARKPVQSYAPEDHGPTDAEVLGAASGEAPDVVCPPGRWYPAALAPPMAASRLGWPVPHLGDLVAETRWRLPRVDIGVVETAGGLRSPQAADGDALDLASALSPDLVVVVADAGLGTIHAVRLVSGALAARDLDYVTVLNRFERTDELHVDNLHWLRKQDGLNVLAGDDAGIAQLATWVATVLSTTR